MRRRSAGGSAPFSPAVLVVQPLFAHYRYATFLHLSKSEEYRFAFAAGRDIGDGTLDTFDIDQVKDATLLDNRWWGAVLWQRGLVRLVMSGRYSAIVITGSANHISTWVAAVLARMRGVKVLFWTTGWHRPDSGVKRWVRLAFYSLADRLLLYNELGLQLGARAGYPTSKMSVIFNSQGSPATTTPSAASFDEPGQSLVADSGAPVITAVVRLNPSKRLDQLVRAAAILKSKGSSVYLVFVGDGPERNRLNDLANELGVQLSLPGAIYSESALAEIYSTASLTVIPGAVGLTAVQSLRHGIPVVSHDNADSQVAEWEAIREGETGGYFKENDVADLARVVQKWIGDMASDRDAVSQRCRQEYREKWTPFAHAERIIDGIRLTVSEKAGRS